MIDLQRKLGNLKINLYNPKYKFGYRDITEVRIGYRASGHNPRGVELKIDQCTVYNAVLERKKSSASENSAQ